MTSSPDRAVVKVSISLPRADLEFLDSMVSDGQAANRSSAVHRAVDHVRPSFFTTGIYVVSAEGNPRALRASPVLNDKTRGDVGNLLGPRVRVRRR